MKKIVAMIIGLLPFNCFRIFLMRIILRYDISYDSRVGWGNYICCNHVSINHASIGIFNRVSCNSLILETGAEIRKFNTVKLINSLVLCKDSQVVSRNDFIGLYRADYKHKDDCNIMIGEKSLITIGNSLDGTRQIVIGKNVVMGGKGTQIWTHGFDIYRHMVTAPVTIGNDIYIGARCTICQGVSICDKTVVGAATCVSKSIEESGFYVSNSLIRKSDIKIYSEES